MKNALLYLLLHLTFGAFGQRPDSLWLEKQVDSLLNFSQAQAQNRSFEQALAALDTAEKLLPPKNDHENPARGEVLFSRAAIRFSMGEHPLAETSGTENRDYAATLGNLGNIYFDLGDYEKTERYWLGSRRIFEKVVGKSHPSYADILLSLTRLYKQPGDFEKAIACSSGHLSYIYQPCLVQQTNSWRFGDLQ